MVSAAEHDGVVVGLWHEFSSSVVSDAGVGSAEIVTTPLEPSTRTRWPVVMVVVAEPVPVTAGSPYSRQTIAAWLIIPPMSVTTAPMRPNTGPQLGAVMRATRISPSCSSSSSAASLDDARDALGAARRGGHAR